MVIVSEEPEVSISFDVPTIFMVLEEGVAVPESEENVVGILATERSASSKVMVLVVEVVILPTENANFLVLSESSLILNCVSRNSGPPVVEVMVTVSEDAEVLIPVPPTIFMVLEEGVAVPESEENIVGMLAINRSASSKVMVLVVEVVILPTEKASFFVLSASSFILNWVSRNSVPPDPPVVPLVNI